MEQTLAVERTIWINAPRERVWRAITEPTQLEAWFAVGCPWEIPALQTGATVKFYNTETDVLSATIAALDAPREFTLRWQPDAEYPDTVLVTTFLLEGENGGTRVTITETGYESLPVAARQQRTHETREGYGMSLQNLKAYLE